MTKIFTNNNVYKDEKILYPLTTDVLKKQVRERPKFLKKLNLLMTTPTRFYLAYTNGKLMIQ